MRRNVVGVLLLSCLAMVPVLACGSSRDGFGPEDPGPDGTSSSSGGNGPIGSSSGGDQDSGLGACAAEIQMGKSIPLDIHIMFDASGSMMDPIGGSGSPTKWSSVKAAVNAFIADPKSAGLGVGLQIFPIVHPGSPASCTSNAQCNVGGVNLGKCFLKTCSPAAVPGPLLPCDTAADCPGNAACRPLGVCRTGILTLGDCLVGEPTAGCLIGNCEAITSSSCWGDSCVVSNYDDARVPIATLPGNAAALTTTINALPNPLPQHLTPTSAALSGGLAYAGQYATANPDHVVVMVLATDGFPTRCAPLDIPGVAGVAATGVSATPSIKTFVIGVFNSADTTTATANLNAIASAGGTDKAFIVTTGTSVTTDFQKALEAIRGAALPCEYELPKPQNGTADYSKVNVQFTDPTGAVNILGYKAGAAACDAAGGWYYDVDPSTGGTPKKIVLCPTSCTSVKGATVTSKLEILLGCKTVVK